MKYLCLAYEEENALNSLSRSDWDVLRAQTLGYLEELKGKGHYLSAEALQSVQAAATVRVPTWSGVDHGWTLRRDEGATGWVLSHPGQGLK